MKSFSSSDKDLDELLLSLLNPFSSGEKLITIDDFKNEIFKLEK
jgi:hypothetical protein